MAHWPELQYCKTDLIASKGVVFCKFSQSSSALRALESIADNGAVCSDFYGHLFLATVNHTTCA